MYISIHFERGLRAHCHCLSMPKYLRYVRGLVYLFLLRIVHFIDMLYYMLN